MILYSTFIPLMGYSCLTSRGLSDPIITLLELGNILFIFNVPVEHSESRFTTVFQQEPGGATQGESFAHA